jgi:hypothetical protein
MDRALNVVVDCVKHPMTNPLGDFIREHLIPLAAHHRDIRNHGLHVREGDATVSPRRTGERRPAQNGEGQSRHRERLQSSHGVPPSTRLRKRRTDRAVGRPSESPVPSTSAPTRGEDGLRRHLPPMLNVSTGLGGVPHGGPHSSACPQSCGAVLLARWHHTGGQISLTRPTSGGALHMRVWYDQRPSLSSFPLR